MTAFVKPIAFAAFPKNFLAPFAAFPKAFLAFFAAFPKAFLAFLKNCCFTAALRLTNNFRVDLLVSKKLILAYRVFDFLPVLISSCKN